MTKLYKLTDMNNMTRAGYGNACLWGPGVSHSGTGNGDLCSPGYIHAYTSQYLAILLNPIHANTNPCKLWEAEGEIVKSDNGLKVGCVTLTTTRELSLPIFTNNQRVYFGLLCAQEVYRDSGFWAFVHNWVTGKDRSAEAAEAAARAARAAEAAEAAAWAAVRAARVAVEAARAARAAEAAAWAAAWAAARADSPVSLFNLDELAKKAYDWEDTI